MTEYYYAFLLRLWNVGQEGENGDAATKPSAHPWRASLENVHTGEIHAFVSLEALVAFVEETTQSHPHAAHTIDDAGAPSRSRES